MAHLTAQLTLALAFSISLNLAAQIEEKASPGVIELGKAKFEQVCIACHKYERSDNMIAPPAFGIQMHYTKAFAQDEAGFRKAIVDWTKEPDPAKSLMPGAISKFNLMPAMPLPDEDLEAIAAYLYSAEFVVACDMKVEKELGPNRQNRIN